MKRIKNFLFLFLCAVLIVSINLSVTAAAESSLQTNIALNPSRSGYPSPLESDQGWGGGWDKWDIVDESRDYTHWGNGLAFTGGINNWGGQTGGLRQATIAFGEDHTFNKVIIWHHGQIHIPGDNAEVNLEYWDGSSWVPIDFQRHVDLGYQSPSGYAGVTPDTLTFSPVTGSKVRYSFDNTKLNIIGTQMEHGWIYEFEVYEYVNTNQPPVAEAGGPYQADEGSPLTFSAIQSNDPDGNSLQYRWDFESDGTWDTQFSNDPIATYTWDDDWNGKATLEVSDGKLTSTDIATVAVNNVNPILDQIAFPVAPVLVNTPIEMSCAFTDVGTKDIHTGIWDWGDSGSSPGSVSELNGAGTVTGEHAYTDAGTYRVNLAVTDNTDGSASATAENYVVVYDPQGGFVTGGGWINLPAGAYVPDKTLVGKASFGFVSKYQKGSTVPTGNTQFQFNVANLSFHSENYDWLVVAGSQAKFKGTGTINGKGNYGFMLSAVDGAVDKFRIKIWDKGSDAVIYDNEIGTAEDTEPTTAIGGGSIIIHKGE